MDKYELPVACRQLFVAVNFAFRLLNTVALNIFTITQLSTCRSASTFDLTIVRNIYLFHFSRSSTYFTMNFLHFYPALSTSSTLTIPFGAKHRQCLFFMRENQTQSKVTGPPLRFPLVPQRNMFYTYLRNCTYSFSCLPLTVVDHLRFTCGSCGLAKRWEVVASYGIQKNYSYLYELKVWKTN